MMFGTISSNKSLNFANNPFGGTTPASPSISPRRPIGLYQTLILGGRYERLKELGRGTSGVVHLCRRLSDGKLFAVKEIRYQTTKAIPVTPTIKNSDYQSKSFFSETLANTTQGNDVATTIATRRSLISEGALLSKIPKHKSIVHLEEIGEECIEIDPQQYQGDCSSPMGQLNGKPSEIIYQQSIYLVMEYAAGGTLRDWVYPLHLLQEREDRRERRANHQEVESMGDCTLLIPSCSVVDMNGLSIRKELITLQDASTASVTTPMYVSPNRSTLVRLSTLTTELSDDGLFEGTITEDKYSAKSSLLTTRRDLASSSPPEPLKQLNVPQRRTSVSSSYKEGSIGEWHCPAESISITAMSPSSPMSPQGANKYFPENTLIEWFTQLATAVEFLHSKGIAHRDIKLANILVVEEENNMDDKNDNTNVQTPENRIVCKLCDFGVAATVTSGAISTMGAVSLTDQSFLTNYMRPSSAQSARMRRDQHDADLLFSPRVPMLSPREYSVSACGSPVIWITGNQDPNSPRARRMSRQTHRNFAQTPLEEAISSPAGARVSNVAHATFDDNTVGTPQYMAPEICDGRPHSLQCDVWSLGVSFYEICARRLPFDATNMLALMHKVIENPAKPLPTVYSPRLSAIILSMLAKDPRQRPTMKQVVQMLAYHQKLKKAMEDSDLRAQADPTNGTIKQEQESAISAFLDCSNMGVKDFVLPQQPTNPRTLAQMLSDHDSFSTFTKSPADTIVP